MELSGRKVPFEVHPDRRGQLAIAVLTSLTVVLGHLVGALAQSAPSVLRSDHVRPCTIAALERSSEALGDFPWKTMEEPYVDPLTVEELIEITPVFGSLYLMPGEPPREIPQPARFHIGGAYARSGEPDWQLVERNGERFDQLDNGGMFRGSWSAEYRRHVRSPTHVHRGYDRVVFRSLDSMHGLPVEFREKDSPERRAVLGPRDLEMLDAKQKRRNRRHEARVQLQMELYEARFSAVDLQYGRRPDGIATYNLQVMFRDESVVMRPGDCLRLVLPEESFVFAYVQGFTYLEPRTLPFEQRLGLIEVRSWPAELGGVSR